MPKNSRVGRCVGRLTQKYGYGGAIGICQKSTKQKLYDWEKNAKTKKKGAKKPKEERKNLVAKLDVNGQKNIKKVLIVKSLKGFHKNNTVKYGKKTQLKFIIII